MSPLFGRGGAPEDRGPRSGDERERARREREARRAAREGRPAPTFDDPPPPPTPPERRSSGGQVPPPAPVWPDGAPAAREPAAPATDGAIEPDWSAPAFAEPAGEDRSAPAQPAAPADDWSAPAAGPSASDVDDWSRPAPRTPPPAASQPPARSTYDPVTGRSIVGGASPGPTIPPGGGRSSAGPQGFAAAPGGPQPAYDVPFDVEPRVSRAVPPADPQAWNAPDEEPEFDFGRRPPAKRRRWRGRGDDAPEQAEVAEPSAVRVQRPDEAPVGVKRVAASAVASAAGAEGPPRFGAPPRGVPKGRRGLKRVIPLVVLVLAIVVVYGLVRLYQPGADDGTGRVAVTIPRGASVSQIGDVLAKADVVDSSFLFGLRARLSGDNDKLKSGTVELKHDMSYGAALDALIAKQGEAPQAAALTKLTIPEGRSRREIVPLAADAGVKGSYLTAARANEDLDPTDYGAPKSTPSLEGFLFPATYDLKAGATAASLVGQQVRTFKREFAQIDLKRAKARGLTPYDVLIIASMIEREAGVAKDRPLISAVIYNRLKDGMPLGIDATIRYRLNNWTKPLTVSDLATDSDYNTRTNTGLPPTPIGNPGLASLKAAARPAGVDYLYYVIKPGGKGAHAFSSTDAQFQRDVAAYNAARSANGGNDPSGR